MPYVCPQCRTEDERIWVVEDLDKPFGCTGCIRKRGVHAVAIDLGQLAGDVQELTSE